MPDDNILCPACTRKLRLRESDFGQIVQCPLCAAVFRAPPGAAGPPPPNPAAAALAPPLPAPAAPVPALPPHAEPTVPRAAAPVVLEPHNPIDVQRAVLMPGMSLLICGVINLVICLLILSKLFVEGRDRILTMHRETMEEMPEFFRSMAAAHPWSDDAIVAMAVAGTVGFSLFAVATVLGGISMLRLRGYWFAVAGCVSACFTNLPLCMFSIPLGIWSLLILRIPEVREAFGAPSEEESSGAGEEEQPDEG